MRTLQSVPNIGGPTTAFPDGSIIDQTGETDGTALTEILYGDLIQTVHKLKRLAAITENNLPDNETNGFQMLTALFANCLPTWQAPASMVDFSKTKWVTYNNGVYYHKTAVNTTNNPAIDITNWAVVFYWNGTKIVYSARIEDLLFSQNETITGEVTGIVSRELKVTRAGRIVCVDGLFAPTASPSASDVVAQLPVGLRPSITQHPIATNSSGSVRMSLDINGNLKYIDLILPAFENNSINFSFII